MSARGLPPQPVVHRRLRARPRASPRRSTELGIPDAIVLECGGTSSNVSVVTRRAPRAALGPGDGPAHRDPLDRLLGRRRGRRQHGRVGRRASSRSGPRSAHIAGLAYACFADPAELEAAQARAGRPAPRRSRRNTRSCVARRRPLRADGDVRRQRPRPGRRAALTLSGSRDGRPAGVRAPQPAAWRCGRRGGRAGRARRRGRGRSPRQSRTRPGQHDLVPERPAGRPRRRGRARSSARSPRRLGLPVVPPRASRGPLVDRRCHVPVFAPRSARPDAPARRVDAGQGASSWPATPSAHASKLGRRPATRLGRDLLRADEGVDARGGDRRSGPRDRSGRPPPAPREPERLDAAAGALEIDAGGASTEVAASDFYRVYSEQRLRARVAVVDAPRRRARSPSGRAAGFLRAREPNSSSALRDVRR